MISLLRKTIELLRENPILLLPYLASQLLAFGLWRLWGVVRTSIFQWFTTGHSVLGGGVPTSDHSALGDASMVAIPVGVVVVFAVMCLFVAALRTTASTVDAVSREQKIDVREILARSANDLRSTALLSLAILATFGVLGAGFAAMSYYLRYVIQNPYIRNSAMVVPGMMLVTVGCAAWLVMPVAIRSLRMDKTAPVLAQARNQGTIVVILACAGGAVLGMVLQKLETRVVLDTQGEYAALSVLNSILANAPNALLYIALSVLAKDESETVESSQWPGFRQFLQALMPMHFRQTKEPE